MCFSDKLTELKLNIQIQINIMRAYPKKCKHLNNVLRSKEYSDWKIQNLEESFSKIFGKLEKVRSKFWNVRKIGRNQMNEASLCIGV